MEKLKVLIGRSSQCDYVIPNPEQHGTVSGKHATLSETDNPNTFLFEDHSTNGSYINGKLLHNNSCTVNVTDYITLGKTYILPLGDIIKRYFSSSKTTRKEPQNKLDNGTKTILTVNRPIADASHNATCLLPQDNNATQLLSQNNEDIYSTSLTEEKVVTKEVEKVPIWYWGLYIASVTAAFILGFLINC